MGSCVYKIKFNKSSSFLNNCYEGFSDIEKEKISELGADSYFDYNDDEGYVCFLITTPLEISKYFKILSNNYIEYEHIDLSEDILYKRYDLEKELSDKINPLNSMKWGLFIDDVDIWISENLHIDLVLDLISKVGIDNLSRNEKEFLNKYSKCLNNN